MQTLNNAVKEYTAQLRNGQIQKAYKGIMAFMARLKNHMENQYPEYISSALYLGYMDMTYFAFTPLELKDRKLKIAVVYLHEQNRFEVWLGGVNRKVQAEYIELMKSKDIGDYKVSQALPGVDSIIELTVAGQPDFDRIEDLMAEIESKAVEFAENIRSILDN
ncbi:MAG: hypothetical protein QMB62_02485 [Oscillospiraceae bacterium]